jgi:hypothetical protein
VVGLSGFYLLVEVKTLLARWWWWGPSREEEAEREGFEGLLGEEEGPGDELNHRL